MPHRRGVRPDQAQGPTRYSAEATRSPAASSTRCATSDVRIPEDVAVVGFDNWEVVSKQTRPPLTTIDMELKELGHQAGLAILELAKGEEVAPGTNRLPCSLVVRQSCGSMTR